jgi:hypothetical protein
VKAIIFFLTLILFVSCKNQDDECNDNVNEPAVIIVDERISLNLIDNNGHSLFKTTYDINELEVYENGSPINYKVWPGDTIFAILPQIHFGNTVRRNWGNTIGTEIVLKFNATSEDRLSGSLQPFEDECGNSYYSFITYQYNDSLVINLGETAGLGKDTLIKIVK